MKKENVFIASMTAIGAVTGFWVIAILTAIELSPLDRTILSQTEKHQFELQQSAVKLLALSNRSWVTLSFSLVISAVAIVLLLRTINPSIGRNTFRSKGPFLKFATAFGLSFIVTPLAIVLLKEALSVSSELLTPWEIRDADPTGSAAVPSILFHVIVTNGLQFGVIWMLLGEKGWLGDLSSRDVSLRENGREWRGTFAMGMLVGIGTALTLVLQGWFFGRYFVLVNEVLDRSSETSFTGFLHFFVELTVLMGLLGCIFAGLTVALAPVQREPGYRKRKLRMPIGIFAAMTAGMLVVYAFGSVRYDLNKQSLAGAVGIPDGSSKSMTLIVTECGQDRKTPRAFSWPLQIIVWGKTKHGTVEVTPENLDRISRYLDEHPQGSVFRYAAREALMKGYNALGDTDKSLALQYSYSTDMLMPRVKLIRRLSCLPLSEQNREYLDSFTDKDRWHVGARFSLKLAEAYIHQGRLAEARKWIQQARDANYNAGEIKKVAVPSGPVLTTGRVSGTLLLNGTVPKGTKVLLFSDIGTPLIEADVSSAVAAETVHNAMETRLADAGKPDGRGYFSFDRLGAGKYFIALMAGPESVPGDAPPDGLRIRNNPGVFSLDGRRPSMDLGKVEIDVRR